MKRVLLIGEVYSSNLGDGIICDVVSEEISKETDFEVSVFDMSLHDDYKHFNNINFNFFKKELSFIRSKIEHSVLNIGIDHNEKRLKKKFSSYQEKLEGEVKDKLPIAIVVAGGQMFNDTFIERLKETVYIASEYKIPIFFNSCGFGNFVSEKLINNLNNILKKNVVNYVSVRDGFNYVERLDIRDTVNQVFDSAILTCDCYNIQKIGEDKIGVGIMFSKNHNPIKQVRFWKKIIKHFVENNVQIELFTNGDPYDYAFSEYLLESLGLNPEGLLAPRPTIPEELVQLVSKYKTILSMRLHSLILAYSFKIPAVSISWDKKVSEFNQKVGQTKYCFSFDTPYLDIVNAIDEIQIEQDLFYMYEESKRSAEENVYSICNLIKKYESPERGL